MILITISRVFFHWYEFEAMLKFEAENPTYKKIAEDTIGTTYECSTYYVGDMEERKEV